MTKFKFNGCNYRFKDSFENFIYIKKLTNKSDETIKAYTRCYNKFMGFVDTELLCSEVNEELYLKYFEYLRNQSIAIKTVHTYLNHLKIIIKFMIEKEQVKPFKMLLPNVPRKFKEIYTDEELNLLLLTPKPLTQKNFAEIRTWAMIYHCLETSCRLKDLAFTKISDLDFDNNFIKVTNHKSKSELIMPMSNEYKDAILKYLSVRGKANSECLFCTIYGTAFEDYRSIKKIIREYNLRRGVKKTSVHLFRHTYSTNWVATDGNVKKLQRILGHKTSDTVDFYINTIQGNSLRDATEKHGILGKIAKKEIKKKFY